MTASVEARGASQLFEFVGRHNPFYLLSAACMLAGSLALTNTLTFSPVELARLVPLMVTLNVYEVALIALALYLVRSRGLVRDGWTLLTLQAMFLVDITFLNSEIVTLDLWWGLTANVLVFGLAIAKLAVVLWVLEVRLPGYKLAFVILQLAVLFALPCVFKSMDVDAVSPARFYAAWWAVGLLPAAYEVLSRLPWGRRVQSVGWPAQAAPTAAYLALPYASLLLHLGMLHFVYDIRFYGAHAAPVLIGLALVMSRMPTSSFAGPRDLLVLRVLMPAAGILVSLNNPEALSFTLGVFGEVTPRMLAFSGAFVAYVYCFMLPWAIPMLAVGLAVGLLHLFGPSASQVAAGARGVYEWTVSSLRWLVPETTTGWGILAVVAAFVFLGIGAAVSLRWRPPMNDGQPLDGTSDDAPPGVEAASPAESTHREAEGASFGSVDSDSA